MSDEKTTEKDERNEEVEDQDPTPAPERPTDKKPHPSKGEGRRGNVQLPPEEQRGKPDPKRG